jgi:hypothetical protein
MLRRFVVVFGLILAAAIGLAVFLLGGAAVSGGRLLAYPPGAVVPAGRYALDEEFLVKHLEAQGFQRSRGETATPGTPGFRAPEGFALAAAFEHPLPGTRPFSVWLYRDGKHSGFWLFSEARHPTWAVPSAKAVLKKLRDPLGEAWKNRLGPDWPENGKATTDPESEGGD